MAGSVTGGRKGIETGTRAGGTKSGIKKGGMGAQVDNGAQRPVVRAGHKGSKGGYGK